ncbi:MAG: arginine N-succinyltransferase [bacterium]
MILLRPIAPGDLNPLISLLNFKSFGLTTLPSDRNLLEERINESLTSFAQKKKRPRGESYLFVLSDEDSGKLMGTCGIASKVGGFEPFYAYRIETTRHESKVLKVQREIRMLHLVREHSGPSEIGSLFLSPEHRKRGLGRFLSLSRFVFMAEFQEWFEPEVIAEMRGVVDESGRSPLWDALGKHFFEIEFPEADYLSMKDKRFIGELMPTHPIYIDLLSREAREVIGNVHPETRPALRLLEEEGFRLSGMVDVFEGGPIVRADLSEVRTVRESRRETIQEITEAEISSEAFIVSNTSLDFRACMAPLERLKEGGVRINGATARTLNAGAGDDVRFAPLRPPTQSQGAGNFR